MLSSSVQITEMLRRGTDGNRKALDELLPLVYEELRHLAQHYLRNERQNHTLQPTAIVHQAYIRLVDWQNVEWQNRAHFFSIAAQVMRNILVDYARQHQSLKRGGGDDFRVTLDGSLATTYAPDVNLIALDEALTKLAALDPKQSRIVELRFFSGLSIEETAEVTGMSSSMVQRQWRVAKAWLHREIGETN